MTLKAAFSKRANFCAALVSLPETGNGTILTRGWIDPENPVSDSVTVPTVPGEFRSLTFDMQAKDAVVPAGRRLGLMVFSTDRQYTIRPAPGTQVSLDLAGCSFTIPIVGGPTALAAATGTAIVEAPVAAPCRPRSASRSALPPRSARSRRASRRTTRRRRRRT